MSNRRYTKTMSRKDKEDPASECLLHCFICDKSVKNSGVQILLGRTPFSNIGLPAKIGQLIGDDFLVVIGELDTLCSRCASLISQLDKLETDALSVKMTLRGYIALKYQLNYKDICAKTEWTDVVSESSEEPSQNLPHSFFGEKTLKETKKKAPQVSLLATNKINKLVDIRCKNCGFSTSNRDALQIHSALCLKQINLCSQCGGHLSDFSEFYSYAATCNICHVSFDSEAEYSQHLMLHDDGSGICTACPFESSQKDDLDSHIGSHGLQNFHCSLCQMSLGDKIALGEHLESHMASEKCIRCSAVPTWISKPPPGNEMTLTCLSGGGASNESPVYSKRKGENEYLRSLMRGDSFDPSCNIEFHSCPNCGVTFLNKMLFSEHMKMHDKAQDEVNSSTTQDDVLISTTVSVPGDCSIDDDLEDLFEKLHAETTNSSLVPVQDRVVAGNEQIIHTKSRHQDLNFPVTLKDEHLTFCTNLTNAITSMSELIGDDMSITETKQNTLRAGMESVILNSLDTSTTGNERISSSQESSNEMFDPTDQQTLIYISSEENNLNCFEPQNGIIIENATIDPESGSIHLLPCIINDSPQSSSLLQAAVVEGDVNCSEKEIQVGSEGTKLSPVLIANNSALLQPMNNDSFSCDFCSFHTSIELVLKRHLKIHQGNMVRNCSICNRTFSSSQRLLSHIRGNHQDVKSIGCPLCLEYFDSADSLRSHLAKRHPVEKFNLSCRFCFKRFTSRKSCVSHEESHSEIFRFQCKNCPKNFITEGDLNDHIKWDHQMTGQCRYCGKKIDRAKALKHHELRHMQESNHHECPECKRVFKTKTGLRHHAAVHTGQFKYCCDFCGRGFMSRMMLEEHRSCHTKEERYICDVCGKKFTFQSTYWIHKKWHETPFPYKCNFCERFFKHSSLLAVHKRKHTGERPYQCPHCPLSFPVSGTLKRHIILHTGVYPFNCDICKRGFTARHKFATHLKKAHSTTDIVPDKYILNSTDSKVSGHVTAWDLNDISLAEEEEEEENVPQFSIPEELVVGNMDPPISDQG